MKLFVRQSLTQADERQKTIIQAVMDIVACEFGHAEFLTGRKALDQNSFACEFEMTTGLLFTPRNFRRYRLELLRKADILVFIRTSMSESGAFELAHNLASRRPKPVFYAHWSKAPIRTTLLRDLDADYPVMYQEFCVPQDVGPGLHRFKLRYGKKFAPQIAAE